MTTAIAKRPVLPIAADATVTPCNFRSAGRLSNESARNLTSLHEVFARNLTNSLDVYLGTGLDVRLVSINQYSMEEFRPMCALGGYFLPCPAKPSGTTALIEMDKHLMFTVVDLLLGGSGGKLEADRELTEIDEEIMEGVGQLIAQQLDTAWHTVGHTLTMGKCVKPSLAHRTFPATDKVLRIHFDVNLAGTTGALFLAFQASLASSLVRNMRHENPRRYGSGYQSRQTLRKRMLDCHFGVSGELPNLSVSVRDLAAIQQGSILMLSASVEAPGKLTLEGQVYFDAVPVRQGKNKAMQLLRPAQTNRDISEPEEDEASANA